MLHLNAKPEISICIPAYKRKEFLKRLLESIEIQIYRSYEVIVTDDSPDIEVEKLIDLFRYRLSNLVYHKNLNPLGTPENWNEAMRHAKGKWIKLMHDDDWFSSPDSLALFAKAAEQERGDFIFSSYYNVSLKTGKQKVALLPAFRFRVLKKEPVSLLSRNIIGPPSVVMHRNDGHFWYDTKLKWLVDIDMYARRIEKEELVYIPDPLIKVGLGNEQVTTSVHGAPEIEVPEHFYFLEKTGSSRLKNILVYDYWWRFVRNFELFSLSEVEKNGWNKPVPQAILQIMSWEKKIPIGILKKGVFSKVIMLLHYLVYSRKITS